MSIHIVQITKIFMIDGVDLTKIEMSDYYRRFLVVKAVLTQAQHLETTLQGAFPSFVQLYNNVVELEDTVRESVSKHNLKNYQYNLTLEQIDLQQQKYIPLIQGKRSTYENDLIKKWRSIINLKQSNDEKMQLEKESSGTPNKNLMFLTSEIMKNERIGKIKLEESKLKIENLAHQAEQKLKIDNEELQTKCKQAVKLLEKQKYKQQKLVEEININFYQEKERLLQEHSKLMKLLKHQLNQEKEEAERNEKDIELIFNQLYSKRPRS